MTSWYQYKGDNESYFLAMSSGSVLMFTEQGSEKKRKENDSMNENITSETFKSHLWKPNNSKDFT